MRSVSFSLAELHSNICHLETDFHRQTKVSLFKLRINIAIQSDFSKINVKRRRYTERKTDPKSRYFPMFELTFEKCLIQLSLEMIQPDNPCTSMNHTQYRVESALPRVESNICRKLIQTSENIWIWGLFFFQCKFLARYI